MCQDKKEKTRFQTYHAVLNGHSFSLLFQTAESVIRKVQERDDFVKDDAKCLVDLKFQVKQRK